MSSIGASMKRKLDSLEKSPVTVLQELGVQENETVLFEEVSHETNPMLYSCLVSAFDLVARGSGQSEIEAQHKASANLIAQLMNMGRFKQTLQKVPEIHRPVSDSDAYTVLLEICMQHNLPIPKFEEVQSGGESHSRITYHCQLGSIKRTGTASTIKVAKQIAAREVLEAVQRSLQNKEQNEIATTESEPPEKLFRIYRELKQVPAKPKKLQLRYRHNVFLRLPEENRNEAKKILLDNSSVSYGTVKDRVHLACAALKLEYRVSDIPNHRLQFKAFHLIDQHDCVLAAKEADLYNLVISHLKTMMNLQ